MTHLKTNKVEHLATNPGRNPEGQPVIVSQIRLNSEDSFVVTNLEFTLEQAERYLAQLQAAIEHHKHHQSPPLRKHFKRPR